MYVCVPSAPQLVDVHSRFFNSFLTAPLFHPSVADTSITSNSKYTSASLNFLLSFFKAIAAANGGH